MHARLEERSSFQRGITSVRVIPSGSPLHSFSYPGMRWKLTNEENDGSFERKDHSVSLSYQFLRTKPFHGPEAGIVVPPISLNDVSYVQRNGIVAKVASFGKKVPALRTESQRFHGCYID